MKLKFLKKISLTFCAVVCLLALALALLLPSAAQAYTSSAIDTGTNMVKIGEIFNENATTGGTFDRDNLQKLINELAKVYGDNITKDSHGNVDVKDLRDKVLGSSTTVGTQTFSKTQRINNINNNAIIVQFGGITWLASFMSLADTNLADASDTYSGIGSTPTEGSGTDLVLTLWQAVPNGDDSAKWVGNASGYGNNDSDSQGTSPANMYGTSHLRAVTLNNGGQYATSKSQNKNTESTATQSKENKYAKFTMPSYIASDSNEWKSNIASFLVAPRFIDWQKTQRTPSTWNWSQADKCENNDAWGVMGSGNYYRSDIYYENYDNYTQWKDDLVWIPSCPEVGNEYSNNENTGMWGLTKAQRAYNTGSASEYLWLRTGDLNHYLHAFGLTCAGVHDSTVTAESRLVRPALHLNLTSAAQAANTVDKPTETDNNKSVMYNGSAQTFATGIDTDLVNQKVTIETKKDGQTVSTVATTNSNGKQVLNATEAGVYTVTITPKDDYRWEMEGSTNENPNRDPLVLTFTITPRPVSLSVKGSTTYVYGESFSLSTTKTDYWGYASGSEHFVNSDENNITVTTPAATADASGALGVGKYPLIVSFPDNPNYTVSFSGDFVSEDSVNPSEYGKYNGKAATVEIVKRRVVLEIKGSATLTYGDTFNMQDTTDYWSYASGSHTILDKDMHKLQVSVKNAVSGTLLTPGNYDVVVVFNDESGNYDYSTTGTASITVNKAKIDLSDLEAFYARIASVEYRPNTSYTLSPDTALIRVKGNQQISVNLNVSASLSGLMQGGKYVVSDVGTYTLTVTVTADHHDTETRNFTVVISKATPVVNYTTDRTTLIYTSKTLPDITATATIDGIEVPGTIRWTRSLGEVTGDSDNRFTWEFTPTDLINYNVVTGDTTLNIRFVGVRAINVVFDPGDAIFYDTDDINDLKNYLTVVVDFNDDTSRTLAMNEYTLSCQGGTTLVVGEGVRITISYISAGSPVTRTFSVNVQKWTGPVETPPTGDNPDPAPKDPTGDTISKAKEFFENTPLPLGYAALVLGGMLLIILILAIAGRKPKKKD